MKQVNESSIRVYNRYQYYYSTVRKTTHLLTWIRCEVVELVDGNVFDGQVIKDMQSAFCDVPVACHGDNERTGW